MVTIYGMSDKMGAQAFEGDMGRTMFGRGISDKEYSDKVSSMIDAEVTEIMDNAKAKAEQLAKDLGVHLGKITSFNEGSNYPMPMYAGKAMMDSVTASAPAELPVGENLITSDVTITYQIK